MISERIGAVVVLFEPPPDVEEAIGTYVADVDRVYMIENGPPTGRFARLASRNRKLVHVALGDNLGLAHALNVGVDRAARDGFRSVIVMDQDGCVMPGAVDALRRAAATLRDARVAIIAPRHAPRSRGDVGGPGRYVDVPTAMGCGCLLDVAAFREVCGFRGELFIDYVDHEYCMRVRAAGYRIVRAGEAIVRHRLGRGARQVLGRIAITDHDPVRRYYLVRNRFVVAREFGISSVKCAAVTAIEAGLILAFERQRRHKLRCMWQGFLDYRRSRLGRYDRSR
jgi:rhamnosyltransferase